MESAIEERRKVTDLMTAVISQGGLDDWINPNWIH
jgi:hypothetical protein